MQRSRFVFLVSGRGNIEREVRVSTRSHLKYLGKGAAGITVYHDGMNCAVIYLTMLSLSHTV
jgi:hypothetical protein